MKNILTRDSFKNAVASRATGVSHLVEGDIDITLFTTARGTPGLLVFAGKANKPTIYSGYLTDDQRDSALKSLIESRESRKKNIVERRVARSAPHTLKVGDILSSSWGYDQTNVDFYQVTRLVGKQSVELREIASAIDHGERGADYVTALKDNFLSPRSEYDKTGLPFVKRVDGRDNSIRISSYEHATLWDGKPEYQTALGWGH